MLLVTSPKRGLAGKNDAALYSSFASIKNLALVADFIRIIPSKYSNKSWLVALAKFVTSATGTRALQALLYMFRWRCTAHRLNFQPT